MRHYSSIPHQHGLGPLAPLVVGLFLPAGIVSSLGGGAVPRGLLPMLGRSLPPTLLQTQTLDCFVAALFSLLAVAPSSDASSYLT